MSVLTAVTAAVTRMDPLIAARSALVVTRATAATSAAVMWIVVPTDVAAPARAAEVETLAVRLATSVLVAATAPVATMAAVSWMMPVVLAVALTAALAEIAVLSATFSAFVPAREAVGVREADRAPCSALVAATADDDVMAAVRATTWAFVPATAAFGVMAPVSGDPPRRSSRRAQLKRTGRR